MTITLQGAKSKFAQQYLGKVECPLVGNSANFLR